MKKSNIPASVLEAMKKSDKPIRSDENSIIQYAEESEEIRYKLMDLTHDRKIVMSNQLVFSSQPMTTLEVRILRIILSQVESYTSSDEYNEDYVYTVRVKDLIGKLGCPLNKNMYNEVEKASHSLRQRGLFLQNANGNWIDISWFSYVKYSKGEGLVEYKLNPDLNVFLKNLTSNFSQYSLELLLSFRSKYSVRLYETIYSKVTRDTRTRNAYYNGFDVTVTFDLEELKVITATLHKYSGEIANFKRRVIDPALKEISYNSEMHIVEYTTRARTSSVTDTFDFTLYNKEARTNAKLTEAQNKLLSCDDLLNDGAELTIGYITELFAKFDIKSPVHMCDTTKLIDEYRSTAEFNRDFKTALPKAKSDVIKYMLKIIRNRKVREGENGSKKVNTSVDPEAKLTFSYIKMLFDLNSLKYSYDDIGEILALYAGNTKQFNEDFKNSFEKAEVDVVQYQIALKKNKKNTTEKDVLFEYETEFNDVVEYWNKKIDDIKMDIPEEYLDEVHVAKKLRRSNKNQREALKILLEDGESIKSIKQAIDVAMVSQYFLRTHGTFGFFINPQNYYDIASGERDYDTDMVNEWKLSH